MATEQGTQSLIGRTLKAHEGARDAIHIAVLPVVAGEDWILPGSRLKLAYGTRDVAVCALGREYDDPGIGVADPFLGLSVRKGERFFLFLFPGTITGLRHEWVHPVVDAVTPARSESEDWLRRFADQWNFDYDELIGEATAEGGEEGDHWITAQGVSLHRANELGEDHDLFWQHLETLTGKTFSGTHRQNFGWSCSC